MNTHSGYELPQFPFPPQCVHCQGTGEVMGERGVVITCPTCAGEGQEIPCAR